MKNSSYASACTTQYTSLDIVAQEKKVSQIQQNSDKILFVGQAPSKETDGKPPFTGKCGEFLARLLVTTQTKMLEDYEFVNVLNYWPGKGVVGDKFPMLEAKVNAGLMLPQMLGRTVVLLGNNVAKAFGAKNFAYGAEYQISMPNDPKNVVVPSMIVIPHPSGINRFYNVVENRQKVAKWLESIKDRHDMTTMIRKEREKRCEIKVES